MSNERAAQRIVKAIVGDLSDRRGLRHEWESIDEDIQQEIVKTWTTIVLKGLTAEAAALKWQPIMPENLPKVGDEVLRCNMGNILNGMKHGGPYVVVNVNALYEWNDTTAQEFADGGWTHFRPINAPKTGGAA